MLNKANERRGESCVYQVAKCCISEKLLQGEAASEIQMVVGVGADSWIHFGKIRRFVMLCSQQISYRIFYSQSLFCLLLTHNASTQKKEQSVTCANSAAQLLAHRLNMRTTLTQRSYTCGQNCWYPSIKERKTPNGHWNNLKLTKGIIHKLMTLPWTKMMVPSNININILLHNLLRQSLQLSDSCNSQWVFCTCQQVFWPTPHEQTAPTVSGLKSAFSRLPQMFNKIYIRAHRRPLQNSPMFCS